MLPRFKKICVEVYIDAAVYLSDGDQTRERLLFLILYVQCATNTTRSHFLTGIVQRMISLLHHNPASLFRQKAAQGKNTTTATKEQESRAIAGRIAQCRCKLR